MEDFVPAIHPLRALRKQVDEALRDLDAHFNRLHADEGREPVVPERLICASLLQVLCSIRIRSERQLVAQIRYNLLYRRFVGLVTEYKVWHHVAFSKNPERLLDEVLISRLFILALKFTLRHRLLSEEHLSVDGTLTDARASHESIRPRVDDDDMPSGGVRDFHGERRYNDTRTSTTDPDAELMQEKRHGSPIRVRCTPPGGEPPPSGCGW